MGTNYYARIIPSKERKEKLKTLIDNNNFLEIEEEYKSLYVDAEIHLGKRSGGWKFLFNPNHEKYYKLTKESLYNFLNREDIIIYDEYFDRNFKYSNDPDKGHCLWTAKQFMDMATNWGYSTKNPGWSGKEYEEWEKSQRNNYSGYLKYGDSYEQEWKKYSPEYYNFFNDGLRWSTCCDFS